MLNLEFNPRGCKALTELIILTEQYVKMKERTNKINKLLDKNIISKNE